MTDRATLNEVSEGGLSATFAKRSLPLYVAPTTDAARNTYRMRLTTVACWRLDDARFGFDSSFIEPSATEEFRALAALVETLPDAPLAIFGHADPTGRDAYNKRLSGRRAEAVYAVLTRSVAMWEALFKEPHGNDEWGIPHIREMLAELSFLEIPPSIAPEHASRDAIRRFQSARDLVPDGVAGHATRARLIADYMDAICRTSADEPFSLPPDRFLAKGQHPKGKGDYQGCGEFNPIVVHSKADQAEIVRPANKLARDKSNAPNRRILVYLFKPGTEISPGRWPCPRSDEGVDGCEKRFWSDAKDRRAFGEEKRTFVKSRDTFACRFYHGLAMRSPCETLQGLQRVEFSLVDHLGLPLPGVVAAVALADIERKSTADEAGRVATRVPEGDVTATVEGRFIDFEGIYPHYSHDPVSEFDGPTDVPTIGEIRPPDDGPEAELIAIGEERAALLRHLELA